MRSAFASGRCVAVALNYSLETMFSRNARYLLRRPVAVRSRAFTTLPKTLNAAAPARHEHAAPEQHQSDLVRDAIKALLEKKQEDAEHQEQDAASSINDEDLKQRVEAFQSLFDEARLCVADCHEATLDASTLDDAGDAVNAVFTAFVELLEDLRRANELQALQYSHLREEAAGTLKKLRHDFDAISERGSC